jgi:hypothetical protein
VSIDDDIFRHHTPMLVKAVRLCTFGRRGRLPSWIGELLRHIGQSAAERQGRSRRAQTIRRARQVERSLGFRPDSI